ncbi:MAG: hypothetical protein LUQ09_04785 [Methanomassiliicoccales archaeon]|nr:hypothetical protein [Methanomassiliicoccales archaeon]
MFPEVLPTLLLTLPLLGAFLALVPKGENARVISYLCASISAVSGAIWSLYVLLQGTESYVLPLPSVWGEYAICLDSFGALILLITSLIFASVSMYSLFSREGITARGASLFNLFMLSVVMAMVADHVLLLLVAWETMSLTSFLGVWGNREDKDTSAAWKYLVVTHFGAMLVIASFIFISLESGEVRLSAISGVSSSAGTLVSATLIMMLVMGFGSKLGLLPFHIWMPELYGRAPSAFTALLSSAASNVAVLVLVRAIFGYIGVSDQVTTAMIVMALAAVTALWGALQALVQNDSNRVLAYSSMENMGLILLTLGAAMLFQSYGSSEAAAFAIMAAMFHLISHTVFKSLLLMASGTVRRATGEGNIEKLGGLARTLPALSAVFLVGILAVAALPPFAGFASEWAMFKSLMHAEIITDPAIQMALPLAIATMALATAIASVAYLRLYGFIFMGRPRSQGAACPRPVEINELFPFLPMALLCLLLGVMSLPLLTQLASSVSPLVGLTSVDVVEGWSINMSHMGGLNALGLSIVLAIGILLTFLAVRSLGKRSLARGDTWDCGTQLDARTQYTPTGFSQPLLRVFNKIYDPQTTVSEEPRPSTYIRSVRFQQNLPEIFIDNFYRPLVSGVIFVSTKAKKMQNGSIQTYLAYLMITLIVLLVVLR